MSDWGVPLLQFLAAVIGGSALIHLLHRLVLWLYFRTDAELDEHITLYDRRNG